MKRVVDIIPDSDSHVTVPLGLNPGVSTAAVDSCSCLGRGMELNLYFVQTAERHSAQSHHLHNVHCISNEHPAPSPLQSAGGGDSVPLGGGADLHPARFTVGRLLLLLPTGWSRSRPGAGLHAVGGSGEVWRSQTEGGG